MTQHELQQTVGDSPEALRALIAQTKASMEDCLLSDDFAMTNGTYERWKDRLERLKTEFRAKFPGEPL